MKSQDKAIIIIAHLAMFLARTGFGLLIPLIIYLNSGSFINKQLKENALNILKFQAKITFTYLVLQFLGILYQILVSFVPHPIFTQLNFSPYNPLTILGLSSQIIIIAGIVFAIFGAIITARNGHFRYPALWPSRSKK